MSPDLSNWAESPVNKRVSGRWSLDAKVSYCELVRCGWVPRSVTVPNVLGEPGSSVTYQIVSGGSSVPMIAQDGESALRYCQPVDLRVLIEGLDAQMYVDRSAAADRLAAVGDDDVVDALIEVVATGTTSNRGSAAVEALERWVRANEAREADVVNVLKGALRAPQRRVARTAAQSLVRLAPDEARSALFAEVDSGANANHGALAVGLAALAAAIPDTQAAVVERLGQLLVDETNWVSLIAEELGKFDDDTALNVLLAAAERYRGSDHVWAILAALSKSPRAQVRQPEAVVAIETGIRHNPGASKRRTTEMLGRLPQGRDRLLEILLDEPDPELASDAAKELSYRGDRRVVPAIVERLAGSSEDPEVFLRVLGQFGDPVAVPVVAKLLRGTHSRDAAAALARMGKDGILALAEAWDDSAVSTRSRVRRILKAQAPEAANALIEALDALDELSRARACRILGTLGIATATPAVRERLSDRDTGVRIAAIEAFARLSGPLSPEAAAPLLDDAVAEVRATAIRVSARRSNKARDALARCTADDHPAVRAAALHRLAPVAKPRFAGVFVGALRDPSVDVRLAAAEGLLRVVTAEDASILLDLLADERRSVRVAAARCLGALTDIAVDDVAARMSAADPREREAAAFALAQGAAPGVAALLKAARGPDGRVRAAIAAALPETPGPDAARVLRSLLLDDPEPAVRRAASAAVPAAVAAMGHTRLSEALVESLAELVLRPDEAAREAAAAALGRLGHPIVGSVARRALEDPVPAVRLAGIRLLTSALERIDPAAPFPEWFRVHSDGYVIMVSDDAERTIDLLRAMTSAGGRTSTAAASALRVIADLLKAKRVYGRADVHVSYLTAPSREPELALIAAVEAAATTKPERYADISFHTVSGVTRTLLPDGEALREGQTYELEVAVRTDARGLPTEGQRKPIAEVQEQPVDVELLVTAEARSGLSVEQPAARLVLPPHGDSTANAWFVVHADAASVGPHALAELRLRLFYGLNLLESVVVRAEIVSRFRQDVRSTLELEQPIVLMQERVERGYVALEREAPRALHIDVDRRGGAYTFHFTMLGADGHPLTVEAPSRLTPSGLEDVLGRVRAAWYQIALGEPYAEQVEGTANTFLETVRRLAQLGRDLYTLLFRLESRGALTQIGRFLQALPVAEDSVLQVSVSPDAADFVFPWALVYDKELPSDAWELPDPSGFWGLRYAIEQRLPGLQVAPQTGSCGESPTQIGFMLWGAFRNAGEHRAMLETLVRDSHGQVAISTPPITSATAAEALLADALPADVLYFFTHAHTRRAAVDPGAPDGAALFMSTYDALDPGSPARQILRDAYERARAGAGDDQSWIALSHGRLLLNRLYDRFLELSGQPLVVLNACESAQVTPALTGDSFVHFFLDRGARTFLGTECPMTLVFAHPFAEQLLRALVAGDTIGTALARTRRHFIGRRNPLGLAYTLYGSAELALHIPTSRGVPP